MRHVENRARKIQAVETQPEPRCHRLSKLIRGRDGV